MSQGVTLKIAALFFSKLKICIDRGFSKNSLAVLFDISKKWKNKDFLSKLKIK